MFEDRCYKGGKLHNFKPRYSEEENENFKNINEIVLLKALSYKILESILVKKVYVYDICDWCGKIVKEE